MGSMMARSCTDSSDTVIVQIFAVYAGALFSTVPHNGLTQTQSILRAAWSQQVGIVLKNWIKQFHQQRNCRIVTHD